eukprot:3943419-Prymnesium_polylepis.1
MAVAGSPRAAWVVTVAVRAPAPDACPPPVRHGARRARPVRRRLGPAACRAQGPMSTPLPRSRLASPRPPQGHRSPCPPPCRGAAARETCFCCRRSRLSSACASPRAARPSLAPCAPQSLRRRTRAA